MKFKRTLTITLALTCGAVILSAQGAFAAEETPPTVYPQSFVRTLDLEGGINDYAIYGDNVSVASKTGVYTISTDENGDRKLTSYAHESTVYNVDYDENGQLYFKTSANAFTYPQLAPADDFTFRRLNKTLFVMSDSVHYTLNPQDGTLSFWRNDEAPVDVGEGFAKVKAYGDGIYAVKDNLLYRITEAVANAVDLSYTDFSGADRISVLEAAAGLKNAEYSVHTAKIKDNAYYTRVDPEKIGAPYGDYFTQILTYKADGEQSCLVLFRGTEASVVTMRGAMYVTANSSLVDEEYTPPVNDWGGRRAYVTQDVNLYSSPFMCEATKIAHVKSDPTFPMNVTEKFELDYVNHTFYRVNFTNEQGETVTGFIAGGFLGEYYYPADDLKPVEGGDENFVYDTNIVSAVLAVSIVALVIIAILYLSFSASKKDRKKKKKQDIDEENEGNK